jgi:ATP synthase F1 gamma subunit
MPQLHQLRKERRFNAEFLQLIQTLKNIAASQYHMLEHEKERFEDFMNAFADFFRVVNLVGVDDPLVRSASDVLALVAVTSDSGFMGSLNQGVIERVLETQAEMPDERVRLVVIGEKGAGKFSELERTFKFFPGIVQEARYEQALEIRDYLVQEVLQRRLGKVVAIYPRPLSFTQQVVSAVTLLPCAELFDRASHSTVSERIRGLGFLADARKVVVESSFSDMVEYLAGVWVGSKLYEIFEDSKLSEYAARAMHLEDSAQKLEKEHKKFVHLCFRASHELVDKGMRESFAARLKRRR